jgi:xanthine dehydrogenase/oxidase
LFILGEFEGISLCEHIMERISYEIERDPVEVRLNNIDPESTDTLEVIQTLIKESEYYKRKEEVKEFNNLNRWKKRGLRVAFLSWPAPIGIDYHVLLTVYHGDATVVMSHAGVEIGQGINTRVVQVVAYTLNISMDKIKVKPTTVEKDPNSFITGGSRSTESVCFGAIKCCQIILDRMNAVREELNNATWEVLVEAAFNRGINLQASYRVTANDQDAYRSAGAVVTEVELDVLTGEHQVLRVDLIEDVGLSVNPELDIGQVCIQSENCFCCNLFYSFTNGIFII